MSSCEKCWSDSGGSPERYHELVLERAKNPCTPEEQAGEDADYCDGCDRKTVHQHTGQCVNNECVRNKV